MENSPLIPDNEEEKPEEEEKPLKDKKKSRLGLYVVKNEASEKPKSDENAEKPKLEPKKPELEAAPEPEVPLEKPSEEEAAEIVRPQLVEVIEANEAEQAPDPITDPPVEQFRELVKSGEEPDEAFEKVITELGAEEEEVSDVENSEDETGPELETDNVEEEPAKQELQETEETEESEFEEIDLNPDVETKTELNIEPEPEANEDTSKSPEPAPASEAPQPTYSSSPPPTVRPPFGQQPPRGPDPNQIHTATSAPDKEPDAPEYRQASPAAMALMGGIIGYLIGRRRGRIKTEKKLIPVQKKLEKQVEDMQFDLEQKEKKIRQIAAAKAKETGGVGARRKAPEATLLHAPLPKSDRIGQMLVAAESNRKLAEAREQQKQADTLNTPEEISRISKRVETLNRSELLALSEKIIIDGSSLRQIYETHLIGERGLRRLVAEQMHGGDLKKALQMEIVEREIDFERDPVVRDMASAQDLRSSSASRQHSEMLSKMVEKASANIGGNDEQAAFIRARANYEASQTQKQQKQRRIIDISFIALLLILVTIIIMLIIGQR